MKKTKAHRYVMNASRELNRFGRTRSEPLFSSKNSNTKILSLSPATTQSEVVQNPAANQNLGLTSKRAQEHLLRRLELAGIKDQRVLNAMRQVPRHLFVDQGLASRAYENEALPIGYGQTISQPWMVARMSALLLSEHTPKRVLEIGAGCGYQTAVLTHLVPEVYAIERIAALYDLTYKNLQELGVIDQVRLKFGDGIQGWADAAPFDAIIVAAAGSQIPEQLLQQLAVGGCLVAPEGDLSQRLVYIRRYAVSRWQRHELETVRFVPLKSGTQI